MEGTALRGCVAKRFGSCTKFAEALHWSGRKTRDIVSGRQIANANDIKQMATALGISDPHEFMTVFFEEESTK